VAAQLFVVVIGCGRLGAHLANRLSRNGHGVMAIDVDKRSFGALSPDYSGFWTEGDATEMSVLKQAKVDKADILFATTRDDNVNIMVAQVARVEFGVRRVLARVYDPHREAIYRHLDIEVVSPTLLAADQLLKLAETDGPA